MEFIVVSKRNFFSITLVMLVILFLFMLPLLVKEFSDKKRQSAFDKKEILSGEDAYQMEEKLITETVDHTSVFLLSSSEERKKDLYEWALYKRIPLFSYESFDEMEIVEGHYPSFIVVDQKELSEDEIKFIENLCDKGVSFIFTGFPSVTYLKEHENLKSLLGIRNIEKEDVKLQSLHLFSDFILGGEYVFSENPSDVEERADITMHKPWFQVDKGVKVYMIGNPVGLNLDMTADKVQYPALIFRNRIGNGFIFSFDEELMTTDTIGGFLTASMYEMGNDLIYPVVNSTVLTIADAPVLTPENDSKMLEMYSRDSEAMIRDVLLPAFRSVEEETGLRPTFMMNPSLTYESEKYNENLLSFFFQEVLEMGTEIGYSVNEKKEEAVSDKIKKDEEVLNKISEDVTLSVYSSKDTDVEELSSLKNVRTLTKDTENENLLSYGNIDTTIQGITDDSYHHTWTEELSLRSRETEIGYTNILFSVSRILYPSENDRWELLSDISSRNLSTYFKPFLFYEATTLSESDIRVRNFLNVSYDVKNLKDQMEIDVKNSKDCYFIIRLHDRTISEMEGGSFKEIEKDCFLINVTDEKAVLTLENSSDYYGKH